VPGKDSGVKTNDCWVEAKRVSNNYVPIASRMVGLLVLEQPFL